MKGKSESEVAQSCPTLRDPMDCSLPGSSVHGIFQARVLEWGAIAFSDKWTQAIQICVVQGQTVIYFIHGAVGPTQSVLIWGHHRRVVGCDSLLLFPGQNHSVVL